MSAGVKTEFIYYNQPGDPRLEFGLHGDFPIRALSSYCEDFRTYLQVLKKAVSRNNIMIVIGGFGEEGEIADITGRAVGRKTIDYNYESLGFGKISNAPKRLPEQCLPLIDSKGTFCGILLESGPQAIFLLSENVKDRAYIVKELITPYVFEFYCSKIRDK